MRIALTYRDLAGAQFAIAYFAVPPFLLSPTPLVLRQWDVMYNRGAALIPPLALISTSAFGWLAYKVAAPDKARLYATAAASVFGIIPYTLLVMLPTNKKLQKKVEEANKSKAKDELVETGVAKGESAKELVDKWNTLHLGRSFFPLISALLGTWAAVS